MGQKESDQNNEDSREDKGEKSILETILARNEPVTADTQTLFEKARENPDAFADMLNAQVNKHLGFNRR